MHPDPQMRRLIHAAVHRGALQSDQMINASQLVHPQQ
jgi:hypothetical protein